MSGTVGIGAAVPARRSVEWVGQAEDGEIVPVVVRVIGDDLYEIDIPPNVIRVRMVERR